MNEFKTALVKAIEEYIRAARKDGTCGMSIANLKQCVRPPVGGPSGTNAQEEMGIHVSYNLLTDKERSVVDETLEHLVSTLKRKHMKFNGSDPIERVAEAIAMFIFEDRPLNP